MKNATSPEADRRREESSGIGHITPLAGLARTETMNPHDERERLAKAITALRQGNRTEARRLIISVLKENPHSEAAWSWACEVADSSEERVHCLQQILNLNPDHTQARRYLTRLRATSPRTVRSQEERAPRPGFAGLLLTPMGCLFQVPAAYLIVTLLTLALVGGIIYYNSNTDFIGLAGPDFDDIAISASKEQIQAGDLHWKITYEKSADSEFSGLVRHVSPIRDNRVRILTHDILVTSGDYADPAIVSTSVANHRFRWRAAGTTHPEGAINLLHTVPADEEIYRQLLQVRSQDEVIISGREILVIEVFDQDDNYLGEWHDTGCNTLLVNSVTVLQD